MVVASSFCYGHRLKLCNLPINFRDGCFRGGSKTIGTRNKHLCMHAEIWENYIAPWQKIQKVPQGRILLARLLESLDVGVVVCCVWVCALVCLAVCLHACWLVSLFVYVCELRKEIEEHFLASLFRSSTFLSMIKPNFPLCWMWI